MKRDLTVNLGNLLLSLSEITDIANPSIAQHQYRTAFIALEIAKNANASPQMLKNIFTAALLHDIGAISIEEKAALHSFVEMDYDLHCIRGEMLFARTPWLKPLAKIIRYHHRNWCNWDAPISDPTVFSAQVILLADFIERSIDKGKYILHQNEEITERVIELKDTVLHPELLDCFKDLAKKEEFWLDLLSPRLYSILLHEGPFQKIWIGGEDIATIAMLFSNIIDFKSPYTATHTSGVAACAEKLSALFGLTDLEVTLMKIAGYFHDLGKLVIPNSILEKPDKLTPAEFAIIKSHTYYTYFVLSSIGGLEPIARWAAYHHEKLDGSGYPFHCKANEMDSGARIMAVADIFTAIAEDRPYRAGMSKEAIYKVIRGQSDHNLLDAKFVDLLFDNYDEVYAYVREKQQTARSFYEDQFSNAANTGDS